MLSGPTTLSEKKLQKKIKKFKAFHKTIIFLYNLHKTKIIF